MWMVQFKSEPVLQTKASLQSSRNADSSGTLKQAVLQLLNYSRVEFLVNDKFEMHSS